MFTNVASCTACNEQMSFHKLLNYVTAISTVGFPLNFGVNVLLISNTK